MARFRGYRRAPYSVPAPLAAIFLCCALLFLFFVPRSTVLALHRTWFCGGICDRVGSFCSLLRLIRCIRPYFGAFAATLYGPFSSTEYIAPAGWGARAQHGVGSCLTCVCSWGFLLPRGSSWLGLVGEGAPRLCCLAAFAERIFIPVLFRLLWLQGASFVASVAAATWVSACSFTVWFAAAFFLASSLDLLLVSLGVFFHLDCVR